MNAPDERSEFQLTPAAKAALQDALKEISAEITLRAAANAHKGTQETAVIGVLDVADALSKTRADQGSTSSRIRTLFIATGLYGMAGVSLLFYSVLTKESFDLFPVTAALMTGTGIPGVTYLILSFIQDRHPSRKRTFTEGDELLQILRVWLDIESAIRSHYGELHGESRASAPITEMIRILLKDRVIDNETVDRIQRLRKVRNSLVHDREPMLTNAEARNLLKDARDVLSSLER
ncbi:hypothetical protein ACGFOM_33165 [Streptomyces sp. NPDC048594]|uniref:hypothetical protein n=1 Tax=Streptomyces sp. NPDC048594 TaxID=3365575 RepID=UPI003713F96F